MTDDDAKNQDEELKIEEIQGEEDNPDALVKKLRAKLKECQQARQEYLAGWQRAKADYINARAEEEKQKAQVIDYAKVLLLTEFLGVADSFEDAFSHREAWEKVDENWRRGVEYIYQKLLTTFETNGLVQLNPVGARFNPLEHHSVGTVHVDEPDKENIILEVVKRGYKINNKIIRPAQVKIGAWSR